MRGAARCALLSLGLIIFGVFCINERGPNECLLACRNHVDKVRVFSAEHILISYCPYEPYSKCAGYDHIDDTGHFTQVKSASYNVYLFWEQIGFEAEVLIAPYYRRLKRVLSQFKMKAYSKILSHCNAFILNFDDSCKPTSRLDPLEVNLAYINVCSKLYSCRTLSKAKTFDASVGGFLTDTNLSLASLPQLKGGSIQLASIESQKSRQYDEKGIRNFKTVPKDGGQTLGALLVALLCAVFCFPAWSTGDDLIRDGRVVAGYLTAALGWVLAFEATFGFLLRLDPWSLVFAR